MSCRGLIQWHLDILAACSSLEEGRHPSGREFPLKLCCENSAGFKDIHGLNFDEGFRKGMHTPFTRAMRKVAATLFSAFTLFSIPHSLQNQARSLLRIMQQFFGGQSLCTLNFTLLILLFLVYTFWRKGDNEVPWLESPFPLGCKLHVPQKSINTIWDVNKGQSS